MNFSIVPPWALIAALIDSKYAFHHLAQRLRVEGLAEARRALEVAEEDRYELPDLLDGHGRRERRAAEPAQAEFGGVLLAAVGAGDHRVTLPR
jgi:hypothetical protein